MTEVVFTFDTTHMALWAEEVAREAGVPVEVIPAPPDRRARCDLALACRPADADRLAGILGAAGVEFAGPRSDADPT